MSRTMTSTRPDATDPAAPTAGADAFGLAGRRTPIELDPADFAEMGHRLVDDVAALLERMRTGPLTPGETPDQVRARLDAGAGLPEQGTDAAELLRETTAMLADHSLYNGHPRFFGYITAGAAPIGVLGDLLAAAVNPNLGAWTLSPMASEIEDQAIRWIAGLGGYPAGVGVLTSGGHVAHMLGCWYISSPPQSLNGGLYQRSRSGPPTKSCIASITAWHMSRGTSPGTTM